MKMEEDIEDSSREEFDDSDEMEDDEGSKE